MAPYIHARLSTSAVTVMHAPSEMTDEQLAAAIKDAQDDAVLDESLRHASTSAPRHRPQPGNQWTIRSGSSIVPGPPNCLYCLSRHARLLQMVISQNLRNHSQ